MTTYRLVEQDLVADSIAATFAAVPEAQPGWFREARERYAAMNALREIPPSLAGLFADGRLADDGRHPDRTYLELLADSVALIADRQPAAVHDFANYVLTMCDDVAKAAGGVNQAERDTIAAIRTTLGVS